MGFRYIGGDIPFYQGISSTTYYGFDSENSLPPYSKTAVRLDAIGRELYLYLNGTLDLKIIVPSDRIFGNASLYVSDSPSISKYPNMIELSNTDPATFPNALYPLAQQTIPSYTVTIPTNYNITFDLTPTGIQSNWSNILQYSQDNTDASGIPGLIFCY